MSESRAASTMIASNVEPPEVIVTVSPTTTDTSRVRSWTSVLAGRLNRMIVILLYPFMVVFTVASLLLVITFCIFPTLICMTFGVCIYYCMMEDPIPLSVLLRYMLSPDPDENQYPYPHPCAENRSAMQSKLIIRKVLRTEEIEENATTDDLEDAKQQGHPRRHPFPIEFKTNQKCLYFSEPILYEDKEEKSHDDKDIDSQVPRYQRLHTHGASRRQLPADDEDTFSYISALINTPPDEDEIRLVEIAIGSADVEDTTTDNELMASVDVEEGGHDDQHIVSLDPDNDCEAHSTTKLAATSESLGQTATEQLGDALEFVEDYFGITDSRERGTSCDICLLSFEKDDEVAWSPNLTCVHSYHKDCILDWLLRKPSCPSCRQNYLEAKEIEDV